LYLGRVRSSIDASIVRFDEPANLMRSKPNIYIFGWPSFVGGADTKLAHLIALLHKDFQLTVIPNHAKRLGEKFWLEFLKRFGATACLFENLPEKLHGWGLALSNHWFFQRGIAVKAKERGLKLIWSSEMMWHHEGELEAIANGIVEKVLYTSKIQKAVLSKAYGDIRSDLTGNYIHPSFFPFNDKKNGPFTIGRLSRAAVEKYPEDFPVLYERLNLPGTHFRVMGWSEELSRKYSWHRFDERWQLLTTNAEAQVVFLHSLDLFVYPLGHGFVESWGRSTVEAMLTGAVAVVSRGHNMDELIADGLTGYLCSEFDEFKERSQTLHADVHLRTKIRRAARQHAEHHLCDREKHLGIWKKVFETA
jgi:glycosyltransferase involved in cell wall biosynthesis